jgi:hypothetical protein
MHQQVTRRTFLRNAAVAGSGLVILSNSGSLRGTPANSKLNIAGIGIGGRGAANVSGVADENIVALCDVDEKRAAETFGQHPNARRYKDFRKMLDEIHSDIDAVVIGTPDHTHAPAGVMAMKMGKHCYCEKPLTHSVYEARVHGNNRHDRGYLANDGILITISHLFGLSHATGSKETCIQ